MKTAKDLYEKIDPVLAAKLSRSGGLRGLFDPYSAEYSASSIPEKVQLLAAICRAGVGVEGAMGAAEEVMRRVGYEGARLIITEGALALLQCAALAVGSIEAPVSELHFDGIMHVFALDDVADPKGAHQSFCGLSIPVGPFCAAIPEDRYHDEPDVPVGDGTYRVCGYCRTEWGKHNRG
jgi:hypothetical protein